MMIMIIKITLIVIMVIIRERKERWKSKREGRRKSRDKPRGFYHNYTPSSTYIAITFESFRHAARHSSTDPAHF